MADLYSILHGAVPVKGGAEEVGNKAWNLMRLAQAGMPVPPAFVLPTAWCHRAESRLSPGLDKALDEGIARLKCASWRARPLKSIWNIANATLADGYSTKAMSCRSMAIRGRCIRVIWRHSANTP